VQIYNLFLFRATGKFHFFKWSNKAPYMLYLLYY